MADLKEWYNADGLKVRFAGYQGQKRSRKNVFVETVTDGNYRELICHYDLTLIPTTTISYSTDRNNDGTVDGFDSGNVSIPAGSTIHSVDIFPTVSAAGGTAIEVGGYAEDGTAIDRDGYVTAAVGVTASLAANARVIGTGAQLTDANAEVGTTVLNYVGIYANGTFTAGKGKIVIRFNTAAA